MYTLLMGQHMPENPQWIKLLAEKYDGNCMRRKLFRDRLLENFGCQGVS